MSKRKIIIIATLTIVFLLCVAAFFIILIQSKTPIDNIYVITERGNIKATRGAFKWRTYTEEIISDTDTPYNIALKAQKAYAYQFEDIMITTDEVKGRMLNNISDVKLYIIDEETLKEVETVKQSREINFCAPKEMGDYYYQLILTYTNGSIVEYEFALNVAKRKINEAELNTLISKYEGKYIGDR